MEGKCRKNRQGVERGRKLKTIQNSRKQRKRAREYESMERTILNIRNANILDREDIQTLVEIRDKIEKQQENEPETKKENTGQISPERRYKK